MSRGDVICANNLQRYRNMRHILPSGPAWSGTENGRERKMSKLEKVQAVQAEQAEQAEAGIIMLSEADLAITGRGRGRGHSELYIAASALPAPVDGKYAALRTEGHKISAVNNTVQALRRDYPGRKYSTRRRGAFIVRLS